MVSARGFRRRDEIGCVGAAGSFGGEKQGEVRKLDKRKAEKVIGREPSSVFIATSVLICNQFLPSSADGP